MIDICFCSFSSGQPAVQVSSRHSVSPLIEVGDKFDRFVERMTINKVRLEPAVVCAATHKAERVNHIPMISGKWTVRISVFMCSFVYVCYPTDG